MNVLVVGAGITGLTCARLLTDLGVTVNVIEATNELGGLMATYRKDGCEIHKYGAHIFHTKSDWVFDFIYRFSNWIPYRHSVHALVSMLDKKRYVQLPLSYTSINTLYDENLKPDEIEYLLSSTSKRKYLNEGINKLIDRIGLDLFEKVIKPYSELQWGRPFEEIPPEVIERIGMKKTFTTSYFSDVYQMMPMEGYDFFLKNLAYDIPIMYYTTFEYDMLSSFDAVIYTGSINSLCAAGLPYRSCRWSTPINNQNVKPFEGEPVLNTPGSKEFTRVIFHDLFANNIKRYHYKGTHLASFEYPTEWIADSGLRPMYPIETEGNHQVYENAVEELTSKYNNLYFAGRFGTYHYMDMDDCILDAKRVVDKIKKDYELSVGKR